MYDAGVIHGGGASGSDDLHQGRERPVLQLSFAVSASAATRRGYVERAFKDAAKHEVAHGGQKMVEAETYLFRAAFASMRDSWRAGIRPK